MIFTFSSAILCEGKEIPNTGRCGFGGEERQIKVRQAKFL